MKHPFLLLTPALVAGILLGSLLPLPFWMGPALVLLALTLYLWLTGATLDPVKAIRRSSWHLVWVILLFVGVGMAAEAFSRSEDYPLDAVTQPLSAVVKDRSSLTSGDRLIVEVSGVKALVKTDATEARNGDILSLPPKFRKIADDPNYFSTDYADRMRRSGILYEMEVQGSEISVIGHRSSLTLRAESLREDAEALIAGTPLSTGAKDFLTTLLLGSKEYMTPATRAIFADAGIAHLLALSGMHIAIVAALLLAFLFPLNIAGGYKLRYLLTIVILWAYTFLTGLAPSTVRASLMATFCFTGLMLERKSSPLNALLAAAFCILVADPRCVYDLGTQLSFLSVASLILFVGPLNTVDHRSHPRLHAVVGALLTSLVATLATWPLISYSFGRLPMLFLPVNILVLPLLPFYIGLSLLYFALWACGVDLSILRYAIDFGYDALLRLCEYVGGGGSSVLDVKVPIETVFGWCAAIAIAGFVAMSKSRRRRRLKYSTSALCAILSLCGVFGDQGSGQLEGFILQNHLRDIDILSLAGAQERRVVMPRRGVSAISHAGRRIVSIDRQLHGLGDSLMESLGDRACDYLIVAGGFRETLEELAGKFECDTLVIHPSVRRQREQSLMEEARRLGIPVHSLRLDGPLRHVVEWEIGTEEDAPPGEQEKYLTAKDHRRKHLPSF